MSALQNQRIPLDELPEAVQKFVNPSSPPPIRMMAAKAMAPMGPLELGTALVMLRNDPDVEVRGAASESWKELHADIIDGVVGHADAHAVVLDALARKLLGDEARVQKIILNRNVGDSTLVFLAERVSEGLSEVISGNQVRLLKNPRIIEALYMNPNARMSTVNKLLDLCQREGVSLSGIPALQSALDSGEIDVNEQTNDDAFNATLAESLVAEAEGEDEIDDEAVEAFLEGQESEGEEDEKRQSKWQKIQHMSASEKMRLAFLGGREDRAILLRDPRKVVHMAAIQSPKVTPGEVSKIAGNRSVPDGVINFIARKREWLRYYPVVVALVNNPKTPLSSSMGFLKTLRSADLRSLQRNKNIPSQLARQARNLYRNKSK